MTLRRLEEPVLLLAVEICDRLTALLFTKRGGWNRAGGIAFERAQLVLEPNDEPHMPAGKRRSDCCQDVADDGAVHADVLDLVRSA